METLPINCSATEITEEVNEAEVTLNSSAQSGIEESRSGVPVENVPTPQDVISEDFQPPHDHQWFFMNAAYGRNKLAQEELAKEGIFSYIPYETLKGESSDGKKTLTRRPVFTSYLFVLAPLDVVKAFVNNSQSTHSLPYLHFVYNHAKKDQYGRSVRMVIPHKPMINFIRLAEFDTYKVHSVDVNRVRFVKDEPVRIIDGVFKGIEGRVARIHNQTTVVVTLNGIVSMTTAYIPKIYMEPLTEENNT